MVVASLAGGAHRRPCPPRGDRLVDHAAALAAQRRPRLRGRPRVVPRAPAGTAAGGAPGAHRHPVRACRGQRPRGARRHPVPVPGRRRPRGRAARPARAPPHQLPHRRQPAHRRVPRRRPGRGRDRRRSRARRVATSCATCAGGRSTASACSPCGPARIAGRSSAACCIGATVFAVVLFLVVLLPVFAGGLEARALTYDWGRLRLQFSNSIFLIPALAYLATRLTVRPSWRDAGWLGPALPGHRPVGHPDVDPGRSGHGRPGVPVGGLDPPAVDRDPADRRARRRTGAAARRRLGRRGRVHHRRRAVRGQPGHGRRGAGQRRQRRRRRSHPVPGSELVDRRHRAWSLRDVPVGARRHRDVPDRRVRPRHPRRRSTSPSAGRGRPPRACSRASTTPT